METSQQQNFVTFLSFSGGRTRLENRGKRGQFWISDPAGLFPWAESHILAKPQGSFSSLL